MVNIQYKVAIYMWLYYMKRIVVYRNKLMARENIYTVGNVSCVQRDISSI